MPAGVLASSRCSLAYSLEPSDDRPPFPIPECKGLEMTTAVQICCDRNLLTPFCPMCGKANKDPALELVLFLRAKAETYRVQAKARSSSAASVTCNKKADQMERWADRVMELAHLEPQL